MKSFTIPKGHREYYFVLALGIVLVFIVIMITIISVKQSNQPGPVQAPTLAPTQIVAQPTQVPFTQPPVAYNREATVKLLNSEEQRIPLTSSDAQAKEHILQLLPSGQNYGTVYSSDAITIDYVQSLDLFKVEILTVDVAGAKSEAENWFKQEGMSQEGICNLPLGFYLNWDTANILKDSNFEFSPLPDGC